MRRYANVSMLQARDLSASGVVGVMNEALYAIIGAIALSKGGEAAANVVREKVLRPLGAYSG